jgi:hypothetical protein
VRQKRILRKIMMVMARAMIMTKRKMGMILSLMMRMEMKAMVREWMKNSLGVGLSHRHLHGHLVEKTRGDAIRMPSRTIEQSLIEAGSKQLTMKMMMMGQ